MTALTKPKITRWEKSHTPTENELAQILHDEGLSYYHWSNAPHDLYSAHLHTYSKVICVVHGSISFILPDTNQTLTLHTGDRLELPANTIHSAAVGGQGVKCFEARY